MSLAQRARTYLRDAVTLPADAALAWRRDRARGVWLEVAARTLHRLFRRGRLLIVEQDLATVPHIPPPADVHIEPLLATQLGELEAVVGRRRLARLQRAAARGRVCLAARRPGRIVGYTWIAETMDRELDICALPMPPDAAYLLDLYVLPEERSRGLGSALVSARLRHARERGFQRAWRLIEPTNRASLRTLEKTSARGTRLLGELRTLKVLHRVRVTFRPLDRGSPPAPAVCAPGMGDPVASAPREKTTAIPPPSPGAA